MTGPHTLALWLLPPPPSFPSFPVHVRRDRDSKVPEALAVWEPGAQGNGEASAEQGESNGCAESSRVTSSRTPCQGG